MPDLAVCTLPAELPDRTLGWDVLAWCSRYIRQPDGPEAGEAWRFTPEQARFVLHWYAVDEAGRWEWTRGVLRRSKGWGKSPVVAALALAELCGPVRFAGWGRDGRPRTQPAAAAWVQLAGVSERQTVNTMSMVLGMCAESPIVDDYGLDVGLTRIYTSAGGRLEPITASAPTAEGARPTFCIQDETHHWTGTNGGEALDRVNRRNVGKIPGGTGRVLETTNAHAVGQGSVAERSYEAWLSMMAGRTKRSKLLYDAREAPPETDLGDEESLMAGLRAAYGDSTWVDLGRIRDECWDPSTPPEDARRFYLDQIAAAADSWMAAPEWAACADPTKVVADRETVTLGFDGSRKRHHATTDSTCLVGCRVSDGHLFEIAMWEQPKGPAGADWQVPAAEVDATVRAAFARWDVAAMFADPAKFESWVAGWESSFGAKVRVKSSQAHPFEWWMVGGQTTKVVRALEQFHGAVMDRELSHDGSFRLTQHVLNCRRRMTRSGLTVAKEHPESERKIDGAVAAVLAWQARLACVAAGVGQRKAPAFVPRRLQ